MTSQDQLLLPSEIRVVTTIDSPYFSCTSADFEIEYFIYGDTVGVLVNTELIFYRRFFDVDT